MTIGESKGYMIGNLTTHNSGTGTVSATTTALSGAGGSAFLTELYAGAVIKAAGQTLSISSVTTDSAAVLQTAPTTPISGAVFEIYPMLNLSNPNLKIPHPRSNFKQWQSKIDFRQRPGAWRGASLVFVAVGLYHGGAIRSTALLHYNRVNPRLHPHTHD
jgi:hypothetical protein